jgi:hypothetical protein
MEKISAQAAYNLVKAALEAKAITLDGPRGAATPEKSGEQDAKYLMALMQGLTQTPQPR